METWSEKRLRAAYEKTQAAQLASNRAMIAAGFGQWTYNQVHEHAKSSNDPLFHVAVAADEAAAAVVAEVKKRETYHGSWKPIKRRNA